MFCVPFGRTGRSSRSRLTTAVWFSPTGSIPPARYKAFLAPSRDLMNSKGVKIDSKSDNASLCMCRRHRVGAVCLRRQLVLVVKKASGPAPERGRRQQDLPNGPGLSAWGWEETGMAVRCAGPGRDAAGDGCGDRTVRGRRDGRLPIMLPAWFRRGGGNRGGRGLLSQGKVVVGRMAARICSSGCSVGVSSRGWSACW